MVICLERGADLHMSQPMPLPLTVSCFSDIQIGFTFLVPAHLVSPGKRAVKWVCVCMRACVHACYQLTRVILKKKLPYSAERLSILLGCGSSDFLSLRLEML